MVVAPGADPAAAQRAGGDGAHAAAGGTLNEEEEEEEEGLGSCLQRALQAQAALAAGCKFLVEEPSTAHPVQQVSYLSSAHFWCRGTPLMHMMPPRHGLPRGLRGHS